MYIALGLKSKCPKSLSLSLYLYLSIDRKIEIICIMNRIKNSYIIFSLLKKIIHFSTKRKSYRTNNGSIGIDSTEYSCSAGNTVPHLMADICATSGCHFSGNSGCIHRTRTCLWYHQYDYICKVKF